MAESCESCVRSWLEHREIWRFLQVQDDMCDQGLYCDGCMQKKMAEFLDGAVFITVASAGQKYPPIAPRFLPWRD